MSNVIRLDLEKRRPKLDCLLNGVRIASRYDDPDEIDTMMRAFMVLPSDVRSQIAALWCDSKACHCYSATLADDCLRWPPVQLVRLLAAAFTASGGGHNGVWLYGRDERLLAEHDPEWLEEP